MSKLFWPCLALGAVLLGPGLEGAAAGQPQKLRKSPAAARPAAVPAPATGIGNLNRPSTDFSDVTPVIEDPQAERMRPKKKKEFFD